MQAVSLLPPVFNATAFLGPHDLSPTAIVPLGPLPPEKVGGKAYVPLPLSHHPTRCPLRGGRAGGCLCGIQARTSVFMNRAGEAPGRPGRTNGGRGGPRGVTGTRVNDRTGRAGGGGGSRSTGQLLTPQAGVRSAGPRSAGLRFTASSLPAAGPRSLVGVAQAMMSLDWCL